ncbi:cyanophycinase [Clostridium formicaceticum]|uniref:Cyanophycinase n=1 Tax=Clostridium formicaceticum TaxID=1497 RepID=A0AAC9RJV4_9CLOT|nr:cyanophycinase [Clostridium formicaceticum]AOY76048.1 cyanophycinase [Clostridium formicaceticum]ARE86408.1 Cyanophycinase [Clostridium formicaceticum]
MEKEENIRLIIIGGGEDKRTDKEILKKVVALSGGDQANIAVITTATNYPLEVGEEYKRIFYDLGVNKVDTINIASRKEANQRQVIRSLQNTNCIFFVGGDQLRISSILGGTEFHSFIKSRLEEGLIVAGTSAGASMMSEVMVVEGDEEDAPRKCTVKMAPGMGFLKGVIIDQHFNQRGRIGRLLGAVAQNPYALGIGIDEDTAIIINDKNELKVIGSGVITIVDGKNINYTNISEQYPDEPLAITNVNVHILPTRYKYSLVNRSAIVYEPQTKEEEDNK